MKNQTIRTVSAALSAITELARAGSVADTDAREQAVIILAAAKVPSMLRGFAEIASVRKRGGSARKQGISWVYTDRNGRTLLLAIDDSELAQMAEQDIYRHEKNWDAILEIVDAIRRK